MPNASPTHFLLVTFRRMHAAVECVEVIKLTITGTSAFQTTVHTLRRNVEVLILKQFWGAHCLGAKGLVCLKSRPNNARDRHRTDSLDVMDSHPWQMPFPNSSPAKICDSISYAEGRFSSFFIPERVRSMCLLYRFSVSVLLLQTLASVAGAAEQGKPNIVFMIADDCTFRDLGCYGGQAYTPNIDKLSGEGMRFTRCFQAAPMCSPTRHNIYTGLYPVTSGAYPNHTTVQAGTQSVVAYLKELGYRVGQSGKTHVAPASVFKWEKIPGNSNPEFDKVDTFIDSCASSKEPFCLLLCSNEPHSPWNKGDATRYPPEQITLPPYFVDTPETRSSMSKYLAEITYFDGQVGEALSLLEKHSVSDNTLVVVVSEQGSSFPFAKWTCYDNGLQSAMIARWPGKIQPGSVNPAMVEYIDLLPTFVEAAGGKPDASLQGASLLPVFAGNQDHKQYVFGIMTTRGIIKGSDHFGIRSVRSEKYKYIWNLTPDVEFENACTNSAEFKSWQKLAAAGDADAIEKVKRYQFRPEVELYDVVKDPLELNNLAGDDSYTAVKTAMKSTLDDWMNQCGDRGQPTEMEALEHMPRKGKR